VRVVVVGASGNAGTALLRALAAEPQVTELVGVARRRPDESAEPYASASWHQVDLAVPRFGDRDEVVELLAETFAGADSVVHLAWLVQPNHERDLLRRANVLGTRRVVEACRLAGVGHLVAASSVGAYAGVDDDEPRDESWPTRGIPTSQYSVDKAAQERELDRAEARGLAVARLRPGLIFDADAGSEITRLFLGALVPPALLQPGALPVLPLPAGMRVQVVHGEDVADAYRRVVVQGATGAFNVASEPVIGTSDIAEVLGQGRHLDVPAKALRPLLAGAWRSRALALDPGWLDMAMRVPVLDSSRAREELGWSPRHDARETLRELLEGMAAGEGTASAPLRPRARWPHDQAPPGQVRPGTPLAPHADAPEHRVPPEIDRRALALYLGDHLSGATGGAARFARVAESYADQPFGPVLVELAEEVAAELSFLHELLVTLELPTRSLRRAATGVGERVSRLVTSGQPPDSGMYLALELELLRGAVNAKRGGWQVLARLAPRLGLPQATFERLAELAASQSARLEAVHGEVIGEVFAEAPTRA